jgi:hypothetical protein
MCCNSLSSVSIFAPVNPGFSKVNPPAAQTRRGGLIYFLGGAGKGYVRRSGEGGRLGALHQR